jgi:hypothetical protein
MYVIQNINRTEIQPNVVNINLYFRLFSKHKKCIAQRRQIPIQRPMRPHPVLGQKILHPKRPHGRGNGATETGTGAGAFTGTGTGTGTGARSGTGALVGALVGDFVGALVGALVVGALVGDLVGDLVGEQLAFGKPRVCAIGPLHMLSISGHLCNDIPGATVSGSATPISVDVIPIAGPSAAVKNPSYDKNSTTLDGPTKAIPYGVGMAVAPFPISAAANTEFLLSLTIVDTVIFSTSAATNTVYLLSLTIVDTPLDTFMVSYTFRKEGVPSYKTTL